MHTLRKVNRKRGGEVLFPAPLALILTLLAGFCLSYLWLCSRCEGLARETKRIEERHEDVRRRALNERVKWERQKTASRIEARLRAAGIEMAFPPPGRVVHLERPMRLADLDPDRAWGGQVARLLETDAERTHD